MESPTTKMLGAAVGALVGGLVLWYLVCAVVQLVMVVFLVDAESLVPTQSQAWLQLLIAPLVFGLGFPPMWLLLPVCLAVSLAISLALVGRKSKKARAAAMADPRLRGNFS